MNSCTLGLVDNPAEKNVPEGTTIRHQMEAILWAMNAPLPKDNGTIRPESYWEVATEIFQVYHRLGSKGPVTFQRFLVTIAKEVYAINSNVSVPNSALRRSLERVFEFLALDNLY